MHVIRSFKNAKNTALSKIINASQNNKERLIGYFKMLPLNIVAIDYIDLLHWKNIRVTELSVKTIINK